MTEEKHMTEEVEEDIVEIAESIKEYKYIPALAILAVMGIAAGLGVMFLSGSIINLLYADIVTTQAIFTAGFPMGFFCIIAGTVRKKKMSYRAKKIGRGLALFTLVTSVFGFAYGTPLIVNFAYENMRFISTYGSVIAGAIVFWGTYLLFFGLNWPQTGKMFGAKPTEAKEETLAPTETPSETEPPLEVEIASKTSP